MATASDILDVLSAEFIQPRADALEAYVSSPQWDTRAPQEAAALLEKLVNTFAEQEGNVGAQHWLLSFITRHLPAFAPHVPADSLTMLSLFVGMFDDPTSSLLPAVIDLIGAVYCTAVHRLSRSGAADDSANELVQSIEPLRAALLSHLVPTAAPRSSTAAAGAAAALRDIVLAVTTVAVPRLSGNFGAVAEDAIVEGSAAFPLASDVVDSSIAAFLATFECAFTTQRTAVAALNALDCILRQRHSLWNAIVPKLCGTTAPKISKRGRDVAPGCLTRSFTEAFAATCSVIARNDSTPTLQKLAVSACSSLGVQLAVPSVTIQPASGGVSLNAATFLVRPSPTNEFADDVMDAGAVDGDAATNTKGNTVQTFKTLMGPLALQAIISMISNSFAHMPRSIGSSEEALLAAHFRGLQDMSTRAALKMQQQEYDRARAHQARGIDGVAVGKILLRTPGRDEPAMTKGTSTVMQPRLRGAYARAAFHQSLENYLQLTSSAHSGAVTRTSKLLQAEALVARALTLVPEDAVDECLDDICERLADTRDAEKLASARSLVLQCLYCLYTDLAPSSASTFAFQTSRSAVLSGSGGAALSSINMDDPIRWMVQPGLDADSSPSGDNDDDFNFEPDTSDMPSTAYSTLLCRALHVLFETDKFFDSALSLLLECPAITVPVWMTIHRFLCMSDDLPKVEVGTRLLSTLRRQRPPVANHCISLLLFYSSCAKKAARVYAIRELLTIRDTETKASIAEYAKATATRMASAKLPRGAEASPADLDRVAERYLKLFALLCTVNSAELFSHLFTAFIALDQSQEWARQLRAAFLSSTDLTRCLEQLCVTRPGQNVPSWVTCIKTLRDVPRGAEPVALMALQVFCLELQRQVKDESNKSMHKTYEQYAKIIVKHCADTFEKTSDIRFMVPALPFTPRAQVEEKHLPTLLRLFDNEEELGHDHDHILRCLMRNGGLSTDCGLSPAALFVHLHLMPETKKATQRQAINAISMLLRMKRSRAGPEPPLPVLGIEEVSKGLLELLAQTNPPTLLMRTALVATKLEWHGARLTTLVHQGVVRELVKKRAIWRSNPELWRDTEAFLEANFGQEAIETLVQLPDSTLIDTLKRNHSLRNKFASYGGTLPAATQRVLREAL